MAITYWYLTFSSIQNQQIDSGWLTPCVIMNEYSFLNNSDFFHDQSIVRKYGTFLYMEVLYVLLWRCEGLLIYFWKIFSLSKQCSNGKSFAFSLSYQKCQPFSALLKMAVVCPKFQELKRGSCFTPLSDILLVIH